MAFMCMQRVWWNVPILSACGCGLEWAAGWRVFITQVMEIPGRREGRPTRDGNSCTVYCRARTSLDCVHYKTVLRQRTVWTGKVNKTELKRWISISLFWTI